MQESHAAVARARWAVATVFFLNGAVVGNWAAQIPQVEERLQIRHSTLGMALLVMAAGSLAAMPLTGPVIARLGSARVARVATPALVLVSRSRFSRRISASLCRPPSCSESRTASWMCP